jgi:hypothetical protein
MHKQKSAFNKIDMNKIKEEDEEENPYDDYRTSHNKGWADEYNSGYYGNPDLYSDEDDNEDEYEKPRGPRSNKMKLDKLYVAAGLYEDSHIAKSDDRSQRYLSNANYNDGSDQKSKIPLDKKASFINNDSQVTTNSIVVCQDQQQSQKHENYQEEAVFDKGHSLRKKSNIVELQDHEQIDKVNDNSKGIFSIQQHGKGQSSSDQVLIHQQIDMTTSYDSAGANSSDRQNDSDSQIVAVESAKQSQLEPPPVELNEAAGRGSGFGGMEIGSTRPKFAKVAF